MKITGSDVIPFPVARVWDALLDPQVLVATIPGCERLATTGEHTYDMTVTAGVAAIKGTYAGSCALSDLVEHESLVMRLQGAGAPGTIDATVQVYFVEPEPGEPTPQPRHLLAQLAVGGAAATADDGDRVGRMGLDHGSHVHGPKAWHTCADPRGDGGGLPSGAHPNVWFAAMTAMPLTDAMFLLGESREHPMHVGGLQVFHLPEGAGPDYLGDVYREVIANPHVDRLFRRRTGNPPPVLAGEEAPQLRW